MFNILKVNDKMKTFFQSLTSAVVNLICDNACPRHERGSHQLCCSYKLERKLLRQTHTLLCCHLFICAVSACV